MQDEPLPESSRAIHARAGIVAYDHRVSARCRHLGDRNPLLRIVAIPLARSADGWPWVLGALAVAAAGEPPIRRHALAIAATIVATGLVVKLVKTIARRARPAGEWGGSYRRSDPHAFPSGHSARAFLLTVLGFALGPAWVGGLLAVWATLVATSRVLLGVHYVSDVVAGAALGIACGLAAVSL